MWHRKKPGLPPYSIVSAALFLAWASMAQAQEKQAVELDSITVKGHEEQASEEHRSYQERYSNSSTGLRLEKRDTPQSITSITRQRLEDENIQTLDDAMMSTAGISVRQLDLGSRTTYKARGFNISNYRIDGLQFEGESSFSGLGSTVNMDLYDHMDVVRGANGLLGGTGDPSATVSLFRKKAHKDRRFQFQGEAGNWKKLRGMVDLNTPLSADGALSGRVVISHEGTDTFRDFEKIKRDGILATVAYEFSPDSRIDVGYQYDYNRHDGASWGANVPIWFSDGTETGFGRKFHQVADWSYTRREVSTWFASMEHKFASAWRLNADYAYVDSKAINHFGVVKANNAGGWQILDPDGKNAYLNALHSESDAKTHVFSAQLNGPFKLFGREHELLLGVNGVQGYSDSYDFGGQYGNCDIDGIVPSRGCQYRLDLPVPDWQNWQGNEYGDFNVFRTNAKSRTYNRNLGSFAAVRFNLTDKAKAILGTRYSDYQTYKHQYDIHSVRGGRTGEQRQRVVTPYLGLTYDFLPEHTAFVSYTDIFKPQTQQDVNGDVIKPIRGTSYEAGVKSDWFGGSMGSSVSYFWAEQENVAAQDGSNLTPDGAQAWVANAKGVRSQGVDAEISGALTERARLYLGYTFLHVDDPNSDIRSDPKHSIRVSGTYRLPVLQDRLTLGASLAYQDSTVAVPSPGRPLGNGKYDNSALKVPGYTLVHLMGRYQVSDMVSLTARVNNLFDRSYVREYGFYNGQIFGEPRSYSLMLSARF